MKKLNFLAICLLSLISFSSCTKDVETRTGTGSTGENQNNVAVTYSEWIPSSLLQWTDTTIDGNPAIHATFEAPLTENMIHNSTVLVYARKMNKAEASVFPAMIYDSNNDYESLYSVNDVHGIQIYHTKNISGVYQRPESNTMHFRYILIDQPVADNTRPDVAGAPQYNMAELQTMSYGDVLNALGIPE